MAAKLHGPNTRANMFLPCAERRANKTLSHLRQSFVVALSVLFASIAGMKPKTEAFLNFLLWSADKLANPTFRNLTDSYESWAYRNGLLRQVAAVGEAATGRA